MTFSFDRVAARYRRPGSQRDRRATIRRRDPLRMIGHCLNLPIWIPKASKGKFFEV